jgi:hypothetical protein
MPVTLTDGVFARLEAALGSEVSIVGEEPAITGYPFLRVDNFNWDAPVHNSKRVQNETRERLQVTIAALDPKEAETLGLQAKEALKPVSDGGIKITLDDGYEINRLPGAGRRYSQGGVGPDGASVFYYQFDLTIFVGRLN